jgi:hypothetical protein
MPPFDASVVGVLRYKLGDEEINTYPYGTDLELEYNLEDEPYPQKYPHVDDSNNVLLPNK